MKTDSDLLLRLRHDKMSRVKNEADMLLRVRSDKKSKRKMMRPVAKSKMRP